MSSGARLRISAGSLRGRQLAVPAGVRPSASRLREALVSIWGERVRGARLLDLFAGSGAVGLEALSRGAAHATFVESGREALAALGKNLELAVPGTARLVRGEALAVCGGTALRGARFDLVFADPPYAVQLGAAAFAALEPLCRVGALLAVEHRDELPPTSYQGTRWRFVDSRRYGDSALSLFELTGEDAGGAGSSPARLRAPRGSRRERK